MLKKNDPDTHNMAHVLNSYNKVQSNDVQKPATLDTHNLDSVHTNLEWRTSIGGTNDAASTINSSSSNRSYGYGSYGSTPPRPLMSFADCGGMDKQIEFLRTVVLKPLLDTTNSNQLKDRFGLMPPKGILLYGVPGTGKTRLAQSIATELSLACGKPVHYIYHTGIDIASKYAGQSSTNLQSVFDEAKARQPCVLFFDELERLIPIRDNPVVQQAHVTVAPTFLELMDELPVGNVLVIAATNRLDTLHPAIHRTGRFNKYLEVLPPNDDGRLQILTIHTKTWKVKPDMDLLRRISRNTEGFTGADISKLCLDAFDKAVTRCMVQKNGIDANYSNAQELDNMNVTENDWISTLEKMKPSNSFETGSVFYSPPFNDFGMSHVVPLIQEIVSKINGMVHDILTVKVSDSRSSIRTLYVWSETEQTVKSASIDNFIIPEVLRSGELNTYPVYALNTEIMSTERNDDALSAKVSSIFSQALAAPKSVLYIQDVNEVWDLLNSGQMSPTVNLKCQFDRLRGSSVVLLASGSTSVASLAASCNPFTKMFSNSMISQNYEIESPSRDARSEFFEQLFIRIIWDSGFNVPWPRQEALNLDTAFEAALDATENNGIGSIIRLYEMVLTSHSKNPNVEDKDAVLGTLWHDIDAFKMVNSRS